MAKKVNFKDLILHEDSDYLVINKPGDVASLHERDVRRKSIVEMAKAYFEDASLCHRLDKETSGALLISKNEEAYKNAAIQFEKRLIKKEYHAICDGYLSFDNFEVNLPIYASGSERVRIDKIKGKPATTIFNTITNYGHYSLLSCSPISGRMHQIRIHLASQNSLIAGDLLYGGTLPLLSRLKRKYNKPKYETEENPIFRRVALHSNSISLTDLNGKELKVNAPYPKDLEVFLKILNKYDSKGNLAEF